MTDGAWKSLGPNTGLSRGDADGWRTAGGVLVFGGWGSWSGAPKDLVTVFLMDNDFLRAGKYSKSLQLSKPHC